MTPKTNNLSLYLGVLSVNLLSINTANVFSWGSPSIPILTSNDTNINPLGKPITAFEESGVANIAILGTILGIILSGYSAQILGRKKTLVFSSIPFLICLVTMANARHTYILYAVRFVSGISAGCVANVLPSYVGEISEDSNRGTLGSVFGVMNNFGHLITFGIGPLLSIEVFSYILLIPASLFLATFVFFVPETPHYFIAKDDINSAKRSLRKLRNNSNIEKELDNLIRVETESRQNKKGGWREVSSSSVAKRGLLVACGLFICQQLTGISFMLGFLQPILNYSGSVVPSSLVSLIVGIVQLVVSSCSALLVDRLGKKVLFYISGGGCSVSLLSLGVYFWLKDRHYDTDHLSWLPITCIIIYYIFFNIAFASLPWVLCGELFSTNIKSFCVTVSVITFFAVGFLIGSCFPFIREAFGLAEVFIVFGVLAGLTCFFTKFLVPETKGRSFEEIQWMLTKDKSHDCEKSNTF